MTNKSRRRKIHQSDSEKRIGAAATESPERELSPLESPTNPSRLMAKPGIAADSAPIPLYSNEQGDRFGASLKALYKALGEDASTRATTAISEVLRSNILAKAEILFIKSLFDTEKEKNIVVRKSKSGDRYEIEIAQNANKKDEQYKSLKFKVEKSKRGISVRLYKGEDGKKSPSYHQESVDLLGLFVVNAIIDAKLLSTYTGYSKSSDRDYCAVFKIDKEISRIEPIDFMGTIHDLSLSTLKAVAQYGTGSSFEPLLRQVIYNIHRMCGDKTASNSSLIA